MPTPELRKTHTGMTSARKPDSPPPDADERVRRARLALEGAKGRARTEADARAKDRTRDQTLVDAARAGDARAFRTLVETHQARLFAVAYGMLRDRDDAMA